MINTLKNLIEDLINDNDEIGIYKELSKIFEKNFMYFEQCNCIEKLWQKTQDHCLLNEIGNIFYSKIKDNKKAFDIYNKYLQYSQPEFYKNYKACIKNTKFSEFLIEFSQEEFSKDIIKLSDKYSITVSVMLCLLKLEKYEALFEFNNNYLSKLEQQINLNIHENKDNFKYLKEINDKNIYFSEKLSEVIHHNDINFLAIKFNPQNIKAYINIIDDFITYGKYEQCMDFYNNNFAGIFNYKPLNSISEVCFMLSEYYREQSDFYKTLSCQKKAIELSLKKV